MEGCVKKVTIICDGGATPNDGSGVGGWGAVLHFEVPFMVDGLPTTTKTTSGSADHVTNNVMELYAVLGGLMALGSDEPYEVLIKTDSQLVVTYLAGLKGPGRQHLLAIADDIRDLVRKAGHEVMVQKVRQSETMRAHALAEQEMAKRDHKPVPMKL
jgi:ribonuclease HI